MNTCLETSSSNRFISAGSPTETCCVPCTWLADWDEDFCAVSNFFLRSNKTATSGCQTDFSTPLDFKSLTLSAYKLWVADIMIQYFVK